MAVAACGGGSDGDDASQADGQPDEAAQSSDDNADDGEQSTASDEQPGSVDSARSGLSNPVEVSLADGGVMVAGIECGIDGANLLIIGAESLEPGALHEGDIEPAAGGGPSFIVQENGDGYTARQSSFDEGPYTITWPTIDDGLTVTLDGCPS